LKKLIQCFREDRRVPIHLRLRGRRGHEGHVVKECYEHPPVGRVQVQQRLQFIIVGGAPPLPLRVVRVETTLSDGRFRPCP
jgi:hypothetical protein